MSEWEPGIWRTTDEMVCPVCGKKLNAHGSPAADLKLTEPEQGDFTVCTGCAAPLRYEGHPLGAGGQLRVVRADEMDDLMASEGGPEALLLARRYVQRFGRYQG